MQLLFFSLSVHLLSSGKDTSKLEIEALANIGGIEFPWVGIDTDGCHYTSCPISAGSHVDWTLPVEVLREYPAVSSDLITGPIHFPFFFLFYSFSFLSQSSRYIFFFSFSLLVSLIHFLFFFCFFPFPSLTFYILFIFSLILLSY